MGCGIWIREQGWIAKTVASLENILPRKGNFMKPHVKFAPQDIGSTLLILPLAHLAEVRFYWRLSLLGSGAAPPVHPSDADRN